MIKRFLFDCGTRDGLASAGLLVMRLGFGLMMAIGHGWSKLKNFDGMKDDWMVPSLWPLTYLTPPMSLVATIFAELGCAALIVLGLATRPAAFVLGFAMVVAAFQALAGSPFFLPAPGAREPAIMYLLVSGVLVITGAGKWSVDCQVYKEKKKKFF